MTLKILILGGYGVFGGRLAHLLADLAPVSMLIAGRSAANAHAFCDNFSGVAKVVPLAVNRQNIAAALTTYQPDIVVDASGPFQDYGTEPYRVIEACIAARINYLDFADAADFVFGVSRYDHEARQAGVFALSGVSSFPVLTAAVLRDIAKDMTIEHIDGGIAPSPYAGIGLNVMRAVVGYAGAPVKLWRGGKAGHGIGLGETKRFTIAAPGHMPLRNLRFSLVDVPDLQVLPPEHPELQSIWMGAGPVPEVLHATLNLLARTRARLRLPSFQPFSRLFYGILNLMKFGEHRGGMYVRARGQKGETQIERSWHLLAEGDDGPFIPSMAIEAIIRKCLVGDRPTPGARPATHALELDDYQTLFATRQIYSGFREDTANEPLYRQILGTAFEQVPIAVQALHDATHSRQWSGSADVRRGRNIFARLIARLFGFPNMAANIPITVTFTPDNAGELWTRDFGGQRFQSHQSVGTGRNQHLLVERFGVISVGIALVVDQGRLLLVPRRWSCLGLQLPKSLLPRGTSFEFADDGRFAFDVTIAVPLIGLIVAYRGTLARTG